MVGGEYIMSIVDIVVKWFVVIVMFILVILLFGMVLLGRLLVNFLFELVYFILIICMDYIGVVFVEVE